MGDKIDKTKTNIGIERLGEQDRKELFNKFVEKGGKVIDDREKKRQLVIDREKQREYRDRYARQKAAAEKNVRVKAAPEVRAAREFSAQRGNAGLSIFERIKLKFALRFMGITSFNRFYFRDSFFKKFNIEYKTALMELQIMFFDIFKQDLETGRRIVQRLDDIKPLYYELIEMTSNLFEQQVIDEILNQYLSYSNIHKKVFELRNPLLHLYKKLFILKPFENTILIAFERAIDLQANMLGKKTVNPSASRKKVRNALFTVFTQLFPRLHWLFCHYQNAILDPYDLSIEKMLAVTDEEKPGRRMLQKVDLDPLAEIPEDETADGENDPESRADEAQKQGLQLMYELDMAKLRKEYDKAGLFKAVSDSDKVLITYLVFTEFDREYSFILTTNKIKYNSEFGGGGRFSYGDKLNDLYVEMRKPVEAMKNYVGALELYEAGRNEKPSGSDKYIEHTKRLESLRKKKEDASKTARMAVKSYLDNIVTELAVLIADMNGAQKYISNPQDVLEFDPLIESDKKLNGKKIYEAIGVVHAFAAGFSFRLSGGGDLAGTEDHDGDETAHKQGEKKTTEKQAAAPGQKTDAKTGDQKDESKTILDELDDLV